MDSPLNAFFSCSYASVTIEKLFAPLSWSGKRTASNAAPTQDQTGSRQSGKSAATRLESPAPANAGAVQAAAGAQTVLSAALTAVAPSPTLHDLAIEETILTGNNAGLARPEIGSTNFVDALMQLATGPDVALAVAARNLLPRIASPGGYGPDGQPIVSYKHDPLSGPVTIDSLADVAGFWSGDWWSDGAIACIASAMAKGEQPGQSDVNLLRARLFGAVSVTAVEVAGGGNQGGHVMAASEVCYFDRQVVRDPGTGALASFYETTAYGAYVEF
jgi:hypothetical protein